MFRKKSIFGKTIPPACEYCENGHRAADPRMILCSKKGVVSPYYRCRRYVYDPLRRIPKRPPKLPTFSADDFILN